MNKIINNLLKLLLAIGIFFIPLIFSWFTLKKGVAKIYKILAFTWLTIYIVFLAVGLMNPSENKKIQLETPQEIVTTSEPKVIANTPLTTKEIVLNNCSYVNNIFHDTENIMNTISNFISNKSSYTQIAEWRTTVFNTQFEQLSKEYNLTPSILTNQKNELATTVYNDYFLRLPLLLNDVYYASKSGDNSKIKKHMEIIKTVIPKIESKCSVKKQEAPVEIKNKNEVVYVVKKSKSGICHSRTSNSYNRTKNYTPYNTIQDCLNSGGRLPKR